MNLKKAREIYLAHFAERLKILEQSTQFYQQLKVHQHQEDEDNSQEQEDQQITTIERKSEEEIISQQTGMKENEKSIFVKSKRSDWSQHEEEMFHKAVSKFGFEGCCSYSSSYYLKAKKLTN